MARDGLDSTVDRQTEMAWVPTCCLSAHTVKQAFPFPARLLEKVPLSSELNLHYEGVIIPKTLDAQFVVKNKLRFGIGKN
jgi:hypothetical protein